MTPFLFVLGELLRTIKGRAGLFLLGVVLCTFLFLASFSSFFLLGTPASVSSGPEKSSGEIVAFLSPRLSAEAAGAIYLKVRERNDVRRVNYLLGQEAAGSQGGAILKIQVTSPSAGAALVEELRATPGIVKVDRASRLESGALILPTSVRIILLASLTSSVLAGLVVGRLGFAEALSSFSEEIKLMRFSGIPEATIQGPIISLGLLCGLGASVLLVGGVNLAHLAMTPHPQGVLPLASGLLEVARVRMTSLLSLPLGLLMGGLVGVLGASLTSGRAFRP